MEREAPNTFGTGKHERVGHRKGSDGPNCGILKRKSTKKGQKCTFRWSAGRLRWIYHHFIYFYLVPGGHIAIMGLSGAYSKVSPGYSHQTKFEGQVLRPFSGLKEHSNEHRYGKMV